MPKPRQTAPDLAEFKRLLSYDQTTGEFTRLVRSGHAFPGDRVGCLRSDGYQQASVQGKTYLLHRLAIYYVTGEWPMEEVDHINGDKTDNRWANLRVVSRQTNSQNERRKRANKTRSRFMGVAPNGRRWSAYLRINGRATNLGTFDTEEEAAAAYVARKRKEHGGFIGLSPAEWGVAKGYGAA